MWHFCIFQMVYTHVEVVVDGSDVMAQLGLEAVALAQLSRAQASPKPHPAWAQAMACTQKKTTMIA